MTDLKTKWLKIVFWKAKSGIILLNSKWKIKKKSGTDIHDHFSLLRTNRQQNLFPRSKTKWRQLNTRNAIDHRCQCYWHNLFSTSKTRKLRSKNYTPDFIRARRQYYRQAGNLASQQCFRHREVRLKKHGRALLEAVRIDVKRHVTPG